MAGFCDSRIIFDNLSTKFTNLLYGRTEGDSKLVNTTLDGLNSLNYKYTIVTNPAKAVLLVNQCCSLIHPDDSILAPKCCQLIYNLVNYQHLQLEGQILKVTIDWCLQALKQTDSSTIVDILLTINALLKIDATNTQSLLKNLISPTSPIVIFTQDIYKEEIILLATQCLEACTIIPEASKKNMNQTQYLNLCADVFMKYMIRDKHFAELLHNKMVISCLKGLQNIIIQDNNYLNNNLGILLGIVRSFMLYDVKGVDFIKPLKLLPSQLSIPEPCVNTLRERKGGKITKLRKNKAPHVNDNKKADSNFERQLEGPKSYIPATDIDYWTDMNTNTSKCKTSDSEYSDGELATLARLYPQRKVRESALNLFLKIIKCTQRRIMFSYWSSFIPDGSPSGIHSICTCILKDPSPSCRIVALDVLLSLLGTSKLYLSQAESSEKSTAFTPYSITLGSMILEMHRCLRFALNERFIPVLTHVLKCFAELVQATPYHRLVPGIITKIVRCVKVLLDHKDTAVQVRALIVLGCVLASEPPVVETKTIFLKCISDQDNQFVYTSESANESKVSTEDIEYANFSTDEEEDNERIVNVLEVPWVLKACLRNLGVTINSSGDYITSQNSIPIPTKLESLQVMSAMARNYFTTLISPYLSYIVKGLEISLVASSERSVDLRLHAGKTLDSIGQAMSLYFVNNPDKTFLSVDQGLVFWNSLLNGPLLTLMDNEEQSALRSVACDCLGSIGMDVFERLAKDKQMVVIMSLFDCSKDEESNVKGAAVRALAISVLYPSLREDSGFVIDTTETIHQAFHDTNTTVRIKSAWSLANLTNALVLNKNNTDVIEDMPESLLINLFNISIKGCSDNDKVKTNTVRALGNLLQLLTAVQMKEEKFKKLCLDGIDALIQNSSVGTNMKVRWNACYSLGKILKNEAIYVETQNWQRSLFENLMNLVIGFKNFKVRINAALALSSMVKRIHYGEFYFATWRALLKALETSENMEDFTEYKHRDNLVDQICLSIGHLTTFLTPEDLNALQDVIVFYGDLVKSHMKRVYERVLPEKAGILTSAAVYLKTFQPNDLNNEQKEILNNLSDIFNNDIIV